MEKNLETKAEAEGTQQQQQQESEQNQEEEDFQTNWEEQVESFDDLGLKEDVLRGVFGYGFADPSPIQ